MKQTPSVFSLPRVGFLALICAATSAGTAGAQTTYAGGTYLQEFNSLVAGAWADDSTVDGWYMRLAGAAPTVLADSSGTASNFTNALSLGTVPAERALGFQPNSNTTSILGLALTNSTADTISGFNLAYTGEQWRAPGNDAALTLAFEYQLFASGTGSLSAASGWTAVSALNFTSPVTVVTTQVLDGNAPGNFTNVSGTVSGVSWAPSQDLWVRWVGVSGPVAPQSRQMVGLDGVSFSAVPEPSVTALMGVTALGLVILLRRRAVTKA